jgi:hypothetical protein
VNRKQWIIAGVIFVLFVSVVFFLSRLDASAPPPTAVKSPAAPLVYCSDEQVKPCVVSFSLDAWDNMFVNILLPDLSFPAFSLVISRGGVENSYVCQRVSYALNTAYCAGPKQPPGEPLTLRLISNKDQTVLAEGNLSIIGLAFPTLGVALYTPPPGAPTPTGTELSAPAASFSTAFPSPSVLPTRTKPLPPYPNPYPNPSYP